jgi:hypothetical protein
MGQPKDQPMSRKQRSALCDIPLNGASTSLVDVINAYNGSDAQVTIALYQRLTACGPHGLVAVNLLRTQKASARAKVYHGGDTGGGYRNQAYVRKQWAMTQLTTILDQHAESLVMAWGWGEDPKQAIHKWVLYVDTPYGQCSFHTELRGTGPDYSRVWDGQLYETHRRICRYAADVLDDWCLDGPVSRERSAAHPPVRPPAGPDISPVAVSPAMSTFALEAAPVKLPPKPMALTTKAANAKHRRERRREEQAVEEAARKIADSTDIFISHGMNLDGTLHVERFADRAAADRYMQLPLGL